jgi:hypothetical protein
MNKVVLYIKDADNVFQAVDLFEDETISVTSKIQDIRDISKVFTDFSQSFTLPASKKNNKVFKHFYNYFISSDDAFDARKKVDARLEINYIPFRDGKIFLNGVKMKDNKAFAYNITFFGNTVKLKDIFADDELESLIWLDNFSYDYNNTQSKSRFTSVLDVTVDGYTTRQPIIVPLITHTKRLFFNSDNNTGNTLSGNIAYQDGGGTHHRGVQYQDLKPALRLIYIIEAIERKYGIEFTREFFDSEAFSGDNTTNRGLYMWLSREKGEIGSGEATEYVFQNFTHSSGDTLADFTVKNITPSIEDSGTDEDAIFQTESWSEGQVKARKDYYVQFDLTVTTSSQLPYSLRIINTLDNNKIIAEYDNVYSTQSFGFNLRTLSQIGVVSGIKMVLSADSAFSATASLRVRQVKSPVFGADTILADGIYIPDPVATVSTIRPTERMPKMKIYDFITGIFKMFNLTSYYIDDLNDADYGKIRVLPLDDYYADNPKIFDITKYTDSSVTDIESTIPFSEIDFKYKEAKTLLMLQHKEAYNDVFGNSEYRPPDVDRGKPYKIEVPFAHMKFEKLFDEADTSALGTTRIMWGYSAGDNFKPDAEAKTGDYDPVLTEPLLFYGIRQTQLSPSNPDQRISWLDNGTHSAVSTYWRPSNSVEFNGFDDDDEPSFTINFDSEVDEFTLQDYEGRSNSLFKKFYQTYIEDAFNAKKRIFKLTAHLPSSILLNYKLNDRFQIGDKVFTINSIDTNLKTGESKLELLNVL